MNKLGAGVRFCCTAGMLQGVRYLAAAVYMSSASSQSGELFRNGLDYVGRGLNIMAVLALFAGIIFIADGEAERIRNKSANMRKGKQDE